MGQCLIVKGRIINNWKDSSGNKCHFVRCIIYGDKKLVVYKYWNKDAQRWIDSIDEFWFIVHVIGQIETYKMEIKK